MLSRVDKSDRKNAGRVLKTVYVERLWPTSNLPACIRAGGRGQEGNCRLPALLQRRNRPIQYLGGCAGLPNR